jgi:hypothetical protein
LRWLLVTFFFSQVVQAQSNELDSLKGKILKMELAINNMHTNMIKSHREFKSGVWIAVLGTVISVVGVANNDASYTNPLIFIGGGISLGGYALVIDSHKYFGFGARRKNRRSK